MKVYEGMSFPEIAGKLCGGSEKAARILFARGLDLLRPRVRRLSGTDDRPASSPRSRRRRAVTAFDPDDLYLEFADRFIRTGDREVPASWPDSVRGASDSSLRRREAPPGNRRWVRDVAGRRCAAFGSEKAARILFARDSTSSGRGCGGFRARTTGRPLPPRRRRRRAVTAFDPTNSTCSSPTGSSRQAIARSPPRGRHRPRALPLLPRGDGPRLGAARRGSGGARPRRG